MEMPENQQRGENDNYLNFVQNHNSEYYLEILRERSGDFDLVQKSFHNTSGKKDSDLKVVKICRVRQRNPTTSADIESDKTLVVHGIKRQKVPGVLQKGFTSSVEGRFGPGVYHSNYFSKCIPYAYTRDSEDGSHFFFVNEIPTKYIAEKHEYDCNEVLPEFYCHKYLSIQNLNEQHEPDSDGSLINTTTDVQIGELYPNKNDYQYMPEYVASRNIVVPKYLVHATRKMEKLV